ncbi:MAG: mechanosensitive ion channel family protein, partial [Propionibacteriaceae bacterium]
AVRSTSLRTYDNRRVVIPNSELYTNRVTVNTAYPHRRLAVDVGIGYGDDIDTAKRIVLDTVADLDGVVADPAPSVLVTDLGDFAVNLQVRFWIDPPARKEAVEVGDRVQHDLLGGVDVVAVADPDVDGETAVRVGGVDGDAVGVELAVGDDDAAVVVGLQAGGAHGDVLDGALVRAGHDLVTDPERSGQQDEDAGEQVLQDVLEREPDGDAADPERTEHRGRGHGGEHHGQPDQQPQSQDRPAGEPTQDDLHTRRLPGPGHDRTDQAGQEPGDQPEQQQDHDADRQVRQGEQR